MTKKKDILQVNMKILNNSVSYLKKKPFCRLIGKLGMIQFLTYQPKKDFFHL